MALVQIVIPPETTSKITRLAFLSRFTDAEYVAIDQASTGPSTEAALVRRYLSKVNAADHIDLAREDLIEGLQAIEAWGLIGLGRAIEIIEAPVQAHEVAPR